MPRGKGNHFMERIIQRIALDRDLPVDRVRRDMIEAIHAGFENPNGRLREIFGDTEPTPEELILALSLLLDDALQCCLSEGGSNEHNR